MSESPSTAADRASARTAGRPPRRQSKARLLQQPRVRLGAVVALAVAAGLIAWAVVGGGGSSSSSPATSAPSSGANGAARGTPLAGAGALGLTAQGLRALIPKLSQPVYWVGPRNGYVYEFTELQNGSIYVRYLPPGIQPGERGGKLLVIATYPVPDGLAALKRAAKASPGKSYHIAGGGLAWVADSYPKSVHVAFPGVAYQAEVYSPSPARALAVARSGKLRPVS